MADQQLHVNDQPHPSPKEAAAHAASAAATSPVWVSEHPISAAITKVKQSTFTDNHLYWMNFSNSKTIHSLDFIVTFKVGSGATVRSLTSGSTPGLYLLYGTGGNAYLGLVAS